MKKSFLFILFFVVAFCVFYGVRYVANPVSTQTAIFEDYENKIDTSGYIVRTEQVYNAPVAGTVYNYVQEGQRAGKNKLLSTVYSGDVSEETLQELNNINKKLAALENSSASEAYTADGTANEGNIENVKNNIIKAKIAGDISKISGYKAQINSIITGEAIPEKGDSTDELKARKKSLEDSITSAKKDIYSQMSGVFSQRVDGLESILTPDAVMSYKVEDYNNIKLENNPVTSHTEAGSPVCKMVNNHAWYVISVVDSETAAKLKTGTGVKVRFANLPGIEAEVRVVYTSTESEDVKKNVVVLKCEQYQEGVFSMRFSKMEIILESYEGYRIPVSAIRNVDGQKGVIVKKGATQVFKPCNIIYTDTVNGTVIVNAVNGARNALNEYDSIVVGEK